MNFNKELLFVAGFIIAVVVLIQYLAFTLIKKQIKVEVAKRFSHERSLTEPKQNTLNTQNTQSQQNTSTNKIDKKGEKEDDESYEIDTPEELKSDGDSYVNPLHSEKNVTDDDVDDD
jgi:hypothetical protein